MCSKYHCMCKNIIAIITIRSFISWYQNRRSCSEGQLQLLPPGPRSPAPALSRVSSIPTLTASSTQSQVWAVSPVPSNPVISRQTTRKSEVVELIVNFRRNAYLKFRGGSNSNEVCLATEKMDRKNTTIENISKNFSQTLDSVLTMANITNRQTDSWSMKKSYNDLLNSTYHHFLKLIM